MCTSELTCGVVSCHGCDLNFHSRKKRQFKVKKKIPKMNAKITEIKGAKIITLKFTIIQKGKYKNGDCKGKKLTIKRV